ncbi:MAG TPA: D-aminoacylase [Terriglobales bacterium]|nr:D-aminoacylase [Terriglobales bacterium]
MNCDLLIENVSIVGGTGSEPYRGSVAVCGDRIGAVGRNSCTATKVIDGRGHALAPGFIDVHTHDDLYLLRSPQMFPKLSQGVTTVVTGNCGISAGPATLKHGFPDPMNLLGQASEFRYHKFSDYVRALELARPALNVASLVGHTTLRNNHLDRLDRVASAHEIEKMKQELRDALENGALGLSTGLAYLSANSASTEEVIGLAQTLTAAAAIYATHLRSETDAVLSAFDEACRIGKKVGAPVVVSHLKCAGVDNWNRSPELLAALDRARSEQPIGCDCYPYAASSSTLDLRQVDERVKITITWSDPHPEMAGRNLDAIAQEWKIAQLDAARRLQPAGAVYHCIAESDMRSILRHPATMIGSDGLPSDPRPHPRLWGTFPRVLGKYAREEKLFALSEAVRKMTSLPAERFGFNDRGRIREGFCADLVLFDPDTVRDTATFSDPVRAAVGIEAVWVNGILSYQNGNATGSRAGRFLKRSSPGKS